MTRFIRLYISIAILSLTAMAQAQITDLDSTGLEKNVAIVPYEHLDKSYKINDILVAAGNKIWVATDNGVHQIFTSSSKAYLAGKNVETITEGKKGEIWAGAGSSIFNVINETEHPLPKVEAQVSDLTYNKGRIWVATNQGIFAYIAKTDNYIQFLKRNTPLKSEVINFIHADEENIVWAGTANGYVRIKGDKWELEDKGYDIILTQANKEGQWMVATDDMWLINKFNRKFPVGLDESLYRGKLNDFIIDGKGRLYFASDILIRYNPELEISEEYGAEVGQLASNAISLACDFNNNIWIGTESSGLYRIVFADIAEEQLVATLSIVNEVGCPGENKGVIKSQVIGGTKPYKYKWSNGATSGKLQSSLGAGDYAVTVTDRNGVESIANIVLEAPEALSVSLVESQRLSSDKAKDGIIEVEATGGSGALSYAWSNGKEGSRQTRLPEGQYKVTVSDAVGCEIVKSYSVKKPKSFPTLDASELEIGQTLRINNLYFLADSSGITDDSYEVLDEVYDFLTSNPKVVIEIGGHTNTIPSHEYCDRLSGARARNVANYLYDKGIPENRLTYKGYGKRNPITEDKSLVGRRKNQRVEVKILGIN